MKNSFIETALHKGITFKNISAVQFYRTVLDKDGVESMEYGDLRSGKEFVTEIVLNGEIIGITVDRPHWPATFHGVPIEQCTTKEAQQMKLPGLSAS